MRNLRRSLTILTLAGVCGCGASPTQPSSVTVQGVWGGGSQAQGDGRLVTCSASGEWNSPPVGLRFCDLMQSGQQRRFGMSLNQSGTTVTGTLFFDQSPRALTGTVQGTTLLVNGSWMQYPGDGNPLAAAVVRSFDLDGSVSGNTMSGQFTVRDTFRQGSGFTGALTLTYELGGVFRD